MQNNVQSISPSQHTAISSFADGLCQICGESHVEIVSTIDRHDNPLRTVMCVGCGLIRSDPIPTIQELADYYRDKYRSDYKSTLTPKRKHILRYARGSALRVKRLQPHLPDQAKCLDVGSGSGEFLCLMNLAGYRAEGLEPHKNYAEYTRQTFGLTIHNTTIEEARIAPESFDAITLNHVLEHLQFPVQSLSVLNGWLKMNGVLAVEVPDIETQRHSPAKRFHYAHIYNFNHQTLKAVLYKAGFDVIEEKGIHGTSLLARKTRLPDLSLSLPLSENVLRLSGVLAQQNNSAYFASDKPYRRFLGKCLRYPLEIIIAALYPTPKAIVQHIYQKHFHRYEQI